MKTDLTSLDLHFLVRELQQLVGAKLDKVYEQELDNSGDDSAESKRRRLSDKKDFLFVFRRPGTEKQMLRIKLPGVVYLTEHKAVFPESPPGFCVFLRKYLTNARVKEIRHHGFERILEILFETKETTLLLVCELFSKGNMILLDESHKIKGLLESQNWESRTIRGGTKYEYPPAQLNTPRLSLAEYEKAVTESPMDSIVKTFAIVLGLGGFYAEELCRRSGIPKEKKRLSLDELHKSFSVLHNMLIQPIKANVSAGEILPFESVSFDGTNVSGTSYSSFNAALDGILSDKIQSVTEVHEAKERKGKEDKIKIVIDKQAERLDALEKGISDNQRKGELIYEHYTEVKELLESINTDRKKMDWASIKKKYADHALIKEIDEKIGTVMVEL